MSFPDDDEGPSVPRKGVQPRRVKGATNAMIVAIRDDKPGPFRVELAAQGATKRYKIQGRNKLVTALAYAVERGRMGMAVELLKRGADPNVAINGKPILFHTLEAWHHFHGHSDEYQFDGFVRAFADSPTANLNAPYDGLIPLVLFPITNRGVDAMEHFINRGADIFATLDMHGLATSDVFTEICHRNLWLYSKRSVTLFRKLLDLFGERGYIFNKRGIEWHLQVMSPPDARPIDAIMADITNAEERWGQIHQARNRDLANYAMSGRTRSNVPYMSDTVRENLTPNTAKYLR